jgi:hypothetical protein
MKWGRVLLAGIGVPVAAFLLVMLVTTGYAFKLAFEVMGPPDQAQISRFAAHLGRSYYWVLQILVTAPAAAWGARTARSRHQLHGACIGLLAGATGLAISFMMSSKISLWMIAKFLLTVGAGWLGGMMIARRQAKKDDGHQPPSST